MGSEKARETAKRRHEGTWADMLGDVFPKAAKVALKEDSERTKKALSKGAEKTTEE